VYGDSLGVKFFMVATLLWLGFFSLHGHYVVAILFDIYITLSLKCCDYKILYNCYKIQSKSRCFLPFLIILHKIDDLFKMEVKLHNH
jgi:hypothetical protein